MNGFPFGPIAALTLRQLAGGRRAAAVGALFAVPVGLALLARFTAVGLFPDPAQAYGAVVQGVFAGLLVPFAAILWGSATLADEIDGGTLVYLFTRPAGRARIMAVKLATAVILLAAVLAVSLAASYAAVFLGPVRPPRAGDLLTIMWDLRAMSLGAAAYAAFAFLLATFLKRPLLAGLIYVFTVDLGANFLPGYLKRVSVRHHMETLVTHLDTTEAANGGAGAENLLRMATDSGTTEAQALWTLGAIAVCCAMSGLWLVRTREFSPADAARSL